MKRKVYSCDHVTIGYTETEMKILEELAIKVANKYRVRVYTNTHVYVDQDKNFIEIVFTSRNKKKAKDAHWLYRMYKGQIFRTKNRTKNTMED